MDNRTENTFTVEEVCKLLSGKIVCGENLNSKIVQTACGCDLMSDVLAFTKPGSVLLTGLTNPQVIRTAEMLDLKAIVFVRSKCPDESTVELAKSLGISIILTPLPLYESCGLLYQAGMAGCFASQMTATTAKTDTASC